METERVFNQRGFMIKETELLPLAAYLDSLGIIDKGKFLEKALDESLPGFLTTCHKRFGTDLMRYRIGVAKDDEHGSFQTEGYIAVLTHVGDIPQGTFEGINTAVLEERLKKFDWNRSLQEITETDPQAAQVFNDLVLLSRLYHKEANWIAELLMIKYWAGTPIEQSVHITDDRFAFEQSHFFLLRKDFNDIDAGRAYNLLCGRAVLQFRGTGQNWKPSHWVMFQEGKLIELPFFDLSDLGRLPFARPLNDFYGMLLVEQLASGDKPEVILLVNGKKTTAFLQADPVAGNIAVLDSNMKAIFPARHKQGWNKNKGKGPPL